MKNFLLKIHKLEDYFANLFVGVIIMWFVLFINKLFFGALMTKAWFGWTLVFLVLLGIAKELAYKKYTNAKINPVDGLMIIFGGLLCAIVMEFFKGNFVF